MAKKYYLSSPNCRTRMRRTGKKNVVYKADLYKGINLRADIQIYERILLHDIEYKCPKYGRSGWYNEKSNSIR